MAQRTTEYTFTEFQAEIEGLVKRYGSSTLQEKYTAFERVYEVIHIKHAEVCNNFFTQFMLIASVKRCQEIYEPAHGIIIHIGHFE